MYENMDYVRYADGTITDYMIKVTWSHLPGGEIMWLAHCLVGALQLHWYQTYPSPRPPGHIYNLQFQSIHSQPIQALQTVNKWEGAWGWNKGCLCGDTRRSKSRGCQVPLVWRGWWCLSRLIKFEVACWELLPLKCTHSQKESSMKLTNYQVLQFTWPQDKVKIEHQLWEVHSFMISSVDRKTFPRCKLFYVTCSPVTWLQIGKVSMKSATHVSFISQNMLHQFLKYYRTGIPCI